MEDTELNRTILEMFGEDKTPPAMEARRERLQAREQGRSPDQSQGQPRQAALEAPKPPARPQAAWVPAEPSPEAQPRFFMKKLRGTANYVENHSNEFFAAMAERHPTFRVVSTSAVSLPDSVCMYITYQI